MNVTAEMGVACLHSEGRAGQPAATRSCREARTFRPTSEGANPKTPSAQTRLQSRGRCTSTVLNCHIWGTLLQQPWEIRGIYNKHLKHNEVVSFLNRERPTAQHHGSHQVPLGECQD